MSSLELHAQILEGLEMQKLVQKTSSTCFNSCIKDFKSTKLSQTELDCLGNCQEKFWEYFNRAQSIAQNIQLEQLRASASRQ
jgi:Tim10/DDP family zinc finger